MSSVFVRKSIMLGYIYIYIYSHTHTHTHTLIQYKFTSNFWVKIVSKPFFFLHCRGDMIHEDSKLNLVQCFYPPPPINIRLGQVVT